jgi:type I restriction enzyme R subunit
MPEAERTIEENLIEQLTLGESQWTYRKDITTEDALWANIRHILEGNNKAILKDVPLNDQEFEQVKNQLTFPTFYDAAVWIAGENGKAMVHVQRKNETLHLMVLNRADKAGGSSVYEVINQYKAIKDTEGKGRNRRFDVTLLINGLPLIHIELKNREHPYMDAFRQIKKYIAEGKFSGPFSCVQMFIVSNAVNTKYIAPAMDTDLNERFLCSWCDANNNPVPNYLDFAKAILRIPEAHEMVTQYIVLDSKAHQVILLRPYQIHAIEAIREASKRGKSGFIWHTTGSGKTLTSYKAARNLLQDIPSIEKTIFLIDRIALDNQTTQAFQSYAASDVVAVDDTENVTDLINKLGNDNQQTIVTTIQKLNIVMKRLRGKEETKRYQKIHSKRIAFIVDECHRTVTPEAQGTLKDFFTNSLWYGFTGTPIFKENAYKARGDLPRTTEEMFGPALTKYTIKDAIRDQNVLGFQVEYKKIELKDADGNVVTGIDPEEIYKKEAHRLGVLNMVLNECGAKLGIDNGAGKTYEGMLTVSSIPQAQKYYKLLRDVKAGKTPLQIDPDILRHLPDYPKFAITYSVSENAERSLVDQGMMQESLDDYNAMFGTRFDLSQIAAYNAELSDRLARKQGKYKARSEQLDFVIVVDRLLTGFDAPCLSTIFVDRDPMNPQETIQMFSRTNRLFDKHKVSGQIVTFRSPEEWKKAVDGALVLYSDGGEAYAVSPDWDETEQDFINALRRLRETAEEPSFVPTFSVAGKKRFAKAFQEFDRIYASMKAFTNWKQKCLTDYGMTDRDYEDYLGQYKNVMDEIGNGDGGGDPDEDGDLDLEYTLRSYDSATIDYEYIVALIQEYISGKKNIDLFRLQKMEDEINAYITSLSEVNPKLGGLMKELWDAVVKNPEDFKDKRVSVILSDMREKAILARIDSLCSEWCLDKGTLMYTVDHYHSGETIPNMTQIKETSDYNAYCKTIQQDCSKLHYRRLIEKAVQTAMSEEIGPLTGAE